MHAIKLVHLVACLVLLLGHRCPRGCHSLGAIIALFLRDDMIQRYRSGNPTWMERGSRRRACLGARGSLSRMQHGHLGGSLRNSNGTVLSARLRMYDSSLCTRRPTLLSYSCPPVWAVSPPVPGTDMIHGDPPYGRHCVRMCDCATVRNLGCNLRAALRIPLRPSRRQRIP